MKNSITSNLRQPFRAFYPFLIAVAVLWAMPRNARAQHFLYVTQSYQGDNIVSKYNATTGAAINANLFKGPDVPISLWVTNAPGLRDKTVWVAYWGSGAIGRYNGTTGMQLFGFGTGLERQIEGIAVLGGSLLLGLDPNNRYYRVAKFSTAGVPVDDTFVPRSLLRNPHQLALFHPPSSRTELFVANGNRVGRFSAITGQPINDEFITGLNHPEGLAVK